MKIEKINDNQIRCTLSRQDLAQRNLKISELAYGTDKAKKLFREMMQQASFELGFEAEDIPVMVEAIPINSECIILVITKVEEPEELDTRFSSFTSSSDKASYEAEDDYPDIENISTDTVNHSATEELESNIDIPDDKTTKDVMSIFNTVKDYINNNPPSSTETAEDKKILRIFSFKSLDDFIDAANVVASIYDDDNSLYKNKEGIYYLVLNKYTTNSKDYNKVCNILSDYGHKENLGLASLFHFKEHLRCLFEHDAIQKASKL